MGKRCVAELAPFDLSVIIIMGSTAALPLEDMEIHILHGIIPILPLAGMEYLLSVISIHWRGFEKVTQGVSTPVVINGRMLKDNVNKERVSDAGIHVMLRQAGADRMENAALAALEPAGWSRSSRRRKLGR